MRIGIDATECGIADGERGGVYQYILHLIRHVIALSPDSRLQLLFALPHYRHRRTIRQFVAGFSPRNVIPRLCPVPTRYLRRWRIPVDFFTGSIDVFHAPSHLGLRCRAVPVVVTVHDLAYLKDQGGTTAPAGLEADGKRWWRMRRSFFAEIAERMEQSVREARLVITVSGAVRKDVIMTFGISPDKVRVVHHGVRDGFRRIEPDVCRAVTAAHGLRERYWLYVGVLDPNKNLATLLDGYARYRQRGGAGVLAIAGQSRFYGDVLKHQARKLGIADSVRFLGFVPDSDLPSLYCSAAGVVMPSPLEGFGLPALEAMACGTPVIAANGGSLPEVVDRAGLLVAPFDAMDFADAMERLDGDQALREQLSAAGMLRAARFSWERTARETLDVYAEAAAQE